MPGTQLNSRNPQSGGVRVVPGPTLFHRPGNGGTKKLLRSPASHSQYLSELGFQHRSLASEPLVTATPPRAPGHSYSPLRILLDKLPADVNALCLNKHTNVDELMQVR